MNKIGLIIGREYFTRVKKKSFLIAPSSHCAGIAVATTVVEPIKAKKWEKPVSRQ